MSTTNVSAAPTEVCNDSSFTLQLLADKTSMVECPGIGVAAAPPTDSSDNSLGNDQVVSSTQVLNGASIPPPQLPKVNYSKTFIRSSSDSNIQVAVSPLPSAVGSFCGVEDFTNAKFLKQDLKGDLAISRNFKPAEENDTFLNASMQLMHLNGEARQRVRQLWTSVQRLGRDNQIGEAGMDLLYVELGNILKTMSAEKLEAFKPLKIGRLLLLASSPASESGAIGGGAAVKALFGSRPTAQLMQCSLFEDQSKFEMTPIRQEPPVSKSNAGTPPNPPTSKLGRFALPSTASLMGIISDAFQEEPTTRIIRLQGCQVRRLVPKSPYIDATNVDNVDEDGGLERRTKIFHRFQLLVPYKTQMNIYPDGVRADVLFPARAPVPYESFIFEVPTPNSEAGGIEADMAEEQVDDWVWALDRVCRFQLHRLEHALREAPTIERYRDTLRRNFPVCISLSWLHNQVDQPTLQRRASVNLSMIQIVKDLYRDKVLLDGHLFSAGNPFENDDTEPDSVSEVVKYMVKKVLEFEHETTSQHRVPGKTGVSTGPSHQPLSPAHRFAKNCEARALAFVERVLQGSSRTQSGGDIYDAISFFCQQEHVSICPVSQDAHPVQMRITTDIRKCIFQVEVQVSMQFKVIELTPSSPTHVSSNTDDVSSSILDSAAIESPGDSFREWAVLDGTLSRQFTLGQLSAPGTVTINYIPPN